MKELKSVGQFLTALMLAVVLISFVSVDASAAGFGGGSRAGIFGVGGFGGSTIKTELSYDALSELCILVNDQITQGLYDDVSPFCDTSSSLAATVRYDSTNGYYVISVKSAGVYYNLLNNSGGVYCALYGDVNVDMDESYGEQVIGYLHSLAYLLQDLEDTLTDNDSLLDLWFQKMDAGHNLMILDLEMIITRLEQFETYFDIFKTRGELITVQLDDLIEAVNGISISADGSTINFDTSPITSKLDEVIEAVNGISVNVEGGSLDGTPIVEALENIYAELTYSGPVASGIWEPSTIYDYVMQGEMWLEGIALDTGYLSSIAVSTKGAADGVEVVGDQLTDALTQLNATRSYLNTINNTLVSVSKNLLDSRNYLSSMDATLEEISSDTGVLGGMNSRLDSIAGQIGTLASAEITRHNQLTVKLNEVIDAINTAAATCTHEYTAAPVVAASCDLPGVDKYTCSLCGAFYYEDVAALGHEWEAEGIGGAEEVVLLEETTFKVVDFVLVDFSLPDSLIPGELYRVTVDGVVYDCIAHLFGSFDDGSYIVGLGNMGLVGCPDTGEPFLILPDSSSREPIFAFTGLFSGGDCPTTVTVSISRLPMKTVGKTLVLPETTFDLDDGQFVLPLVPLLVNEVYTVSYNGVTENFVCFYMVEDNTVAENVFGIGDVSFLEGDFFLMSVPDEDGSLLVGIDGVDPAVMAIWHNDRVISSAYEVRSCSRCGAGENFASLMHLLDDRLDFSALESSGNLDVAPIVDKLTDIENALSNVGGDINIENNTNIEVTEDNDSYNVFFVEDPDGGDDQSIIDLSGDTLTVFGKLLNFLYQVGFKDALEGAGPGIGDFSDFYLDDAEGSADLWAS